MKRVNKYLFLLAFLINGLLMSILGLQLALNVPSYGIIDPDWEHVLEISGILTAIGSAQVVAVVFCAVFSVFENLIKRKGVVVR